MNQRSEHRRNFWLLVEKLLREVFNNGELSADDERFLLELRTEVSDLDDDERDIFFHSEPLYVAADIVGARYEQLDDEIDAKYEILLKQSQWPSNEIR